MKKIYKVLGLSFLALALVVGVGVFSANAALTLDALTVTSGGALTVNSTGANALTIAPVTSEDATGTIVVGATDGTGAITVGSSSAAQALNLGTGAGVSTVGIATGDGANVVTIGSKSVASTAASAIRLRGKVQIDGRLTGDLGTQNDYGLQVRSISAKTSGTHYGIDAETHLKADGTTSIRGTQGVAVLDTGKTSTGGSITGLYGQARADGTFNAPSGFLTGIYGLIEAGPAITADHVSSLWLDSHQNNAVTGSQELLYMTNNGSAVMGQAMYVYGGNNITNLLNLNTVGGMVTDTATTAGASKKIKIVIDGSTYYVNAYAGS